MVWTSSKRGSRTYGSEEEEEETADHYYNIGHITKKSARGHQLLRKSLGLDTSVATKSNTKSANSTKINDEDHEEKSEPIIHEEGLSSSQVEVIEMLPCFPAK